MRLEQAIEALRRFADDRYPHITGDEVGWDVLHASRIVWEFDNLPKEPDLSLALPSLATLGTKEGQVVLVTHGTFDVEPSFVVWTPTQAREIAAKVLELARSLDGKG